MVFMLPEMTRVKPRKEKALKLYRNPVFVAEEWRNRMEKQGLSRAELAWEQGVTRARVSQILNILKLPDEVLAKVRSHGDPMERRLVTERKLRRSVNHSDVVITVIWCE